MFMKIKIRKAVNNDLDSIALLDEKSAEHERIAALKAEGSQSQYKSFNQSNRKKRKIRLAGRKRLQKLIRSKNGFVLVAEHKNKIIGFMAAEFHKKHRSELTTNFGVFDSVFIEPEYRKRKIAKRMAGMVFVWFAKKGAGKFFVGTQAENKEAMSLWRSFGFRPRYVGMVLPVDPIKHLQELGRKYGMHKYTSKQLKQMAIEEGEREAVARLVKHR